MSAFATWLFCRENTAAYDYILDYGMYLMPSYSLPGVIEKIIELDSL